MYVVILVINTTFTYNFAVFQQFQLVCHIRQVGKNSLAYESLFDIVERIFKFLIDYQIQHIVKKSLAYERIK